VAGANDRGSVVLASLGSGRSSGPGGSPRRGGAWLAWLRGLEVRWVGFDLEIVSKFGNGRGRELVDR